ncbi:hypothetical protein As57867_015342, partial [Aphanomyces stellatus]
KADTQLTFIKPGHQRLAHRIPRELIERTALFLADATTFFLFLVAFSTDDDQNALGDLQPLLALGRQLPLDDLWPRLRLHRSNMSLVVPHLAAISKYYAEIDMVGDDNCTVDASTCQAIAALAVSSHPKLRISKSSSVWWPTTLNEHLHISSIDLYKTNDPIASHMLSTMPYLTDLTLHSCFEETPNRLKRIFTMLPTSQITSLTIVSPQTIVMTESMAKSVVQWLETRPVRRLACDAWEFAFVPDWEMRFYAAVASCTTLTSLRLDEPTLHRMVHFAIDMAVHVQHLELDLRDADPSILGAVIDSCQNLRSLTVRDPTRSSAWGARLHEIIVKAPALNKVELFGAALDKASMDSFGAALAASNIASLTLRHYDWDFNWTSYSLDVALDQLGQWLPRWTRLRRLELSCVTRDKLDIDAVGEGLVNSSVTEFVAASITNDFLVHVAPYLKRSKLQHVSMTNLHSKQKGSAIYISLESQENRKARRAIFDAILANRHLKLFSLRQLPIRDEAAKDLARILRHNNTLLRLDVSNNEMTTKGVDAIVQAMQARPCPSLELNLSGQYDRFARSKKTEGIAQLVLRLNGAEIYCATTIGT